MSIRLLQIREFADVARYIDPLARAERALGRYLELRGRSFGSVIAPNVLEDSAAAAVVLAGLEPGTVEARRLASGYADCLRVVMSHGGDLPFTESQIKYVHSLVLRNDPTAATTRRKYRATEPVTTAWQLDAAPSAAAVPAEMAELVAWTRETLDSRQLHPILTIGTFAYRFAVIRPFADANARLARVLSVFLLDICGYTFVQNVSLDAIVVEHREECAAALAGSGGERVHAAAWVQFFAALVAEAGERAVEAIERVPRRSYVASPPPEAAPRVVAVRLSPRQTRVLELMRELGAAKIGELLPRIGSPRATLKKDLRGLVEAGLLVSVGVRKGTVYHVVSPDPPLATAQGMPV